MSTIDPEDRDPDFDLAAVDTTGDGRPDTVVHEQVEGVDTTGDGHPDTAVLRRTSLIDTTGDGAPDVLEQVTESVSDLDGDGELDVVRVTARTSLAPPDDGLGLRGLHHVSVTVGDVEAATRFYTEALGLVPLPRPDFGFPGAWLAAPDGRQVHLIEGDGGGGSANHMAFAVHDADTAVARLRVGIDAPDPADLAGGRQVFLTDPSGNVIELNEQRDRR